MNILRLGNVKTKKIKMIKLYFFKTRYKNIKMKSKNKVKNINLVILRKRYDEIDSIFFVYNVIMRKNQRSFTGTEINVKLS